LLAEQERALTLVRAAGESVGAPARLRARIDAGRLLPSAGPRRSFGLAAGVAAAAAAGPRPPPPFPAPGRGPPRRARARPPPRPRRRDEPRLLERAVGDVSFPSWREPFGWRADGVRMDTLAQRRATTVFYAKRGRRIGYTILDGSPLTVPRDAVEVERNGTEL